MDGTMREYLAGELAAVREQGLPWGRLSRHIFLPR
jgi:hypothetical protein